MGENAEPALVQETTMKKDSIVQQASLFHIDHDLVDDDDDEGDLDNRTSPVLPGRARSDSMVHQAREQLNSLKARLKTMKKEYKSLKGKSADAETKRRLK